jgi:hypothetical protein
MVRESGVARREHLDSKRGGTAGIFRAGMVVDKIASLLRQGKSIEEEY